MGCKSPINPPAIPVKDRLSVPGGKLTQSTSIIHKYEHLTKECPNLPLWFPLDHPRLTMSKFNYIISLYCFDPSPKWSYGTLWTTTTATALLLPCHPLQKLARFKESRVSSPFFVPLANAARCLLEMAPLGNDSASLRRHLFPLLGNEQA